MTESVMQKMMLWKGERYGVPSQMEGQEIALIAMKANNAA